MNKITKIFAVALMMTCFSSVSVAGSLSAVKDPNNNGIIIVENHPITMVQTTDTGEGFTVVKGPDIKAGLVVKVKIEPTRGTKCFEKYIDAGGVETLTEIDCDTIVIVTTDD